MNAKYIRFFISSTFADMQRERNLLNIVLSRLQREYAPQGWTIEWIDLRWGISREAGIDNRTMGICLGELQRCRTLSPRPNFIILSGQRYGWVPIPEVIPAADIRQDVLCSLSEFDRKVFDRWYKLDKNALPAGQYILQPRVDEYLNDVIYESLAAGILRQILPLICRGQTSQWLTLSATAREIYTGLDSETARDTFIYHRELTDIPADARAIFTESSDAAVEGMSNLAARLKVAADNGYQVKIKCRYAEYSSGRMDEYIKEQMYDRLHSLIDRVIKERTEQNAISEGERHKEIAASHRGEFAGRKDLMKRLAYYIGSDSNRPILLVGDSGMGKSAVMAELANRVADNDDLATVVRLCGETPDSSEAWAFMDSVVAELDLHSEYYNRLKSQGRTPGHSKMSRGIASFGDFMLVKIKDLFKTKYIRRVVVIIDAIDNINIADAKEFFNLEWLNVELPPHIKVIVSCTPEVMPPEEYLDKIDVIELAGLKEDAMTVVDHLLQLKGRTITDAQRHELRRVIGLSDTAGIYVKVLADYLSTQPSWCDIKGLPSDLDGLLQQIIDSLIDKGHHHKQLVVQSLRMISAVRLGLSDMEMRELLSLDSVLAEEVASESQHSQMPDAPAVPAIFWTRLQADFGSLLTRRHTPVGLQNMISHRRIAQWVGNTMMADAKATGWVYFHIFNYMKSRLGEHHRNALYEAVRLILGAVISACKIRDSSPGHDNSVVEMMYGELRSLLTEDKDFILAKAALFRDDLLEDFSMCNIVSGEPAVAQTLLQIKREIIQLPQSSDPDDLVCFARNLPEKMALHNIAKKNNLPFNILIDAFRGFKQSGSIRFAVNTVGASPQLAANGNGVASLVEHGRFLKIDILSEPVSHISILQPARYLSSDSTLSMHVLSGDDNVRLIDSKGDEIRIWNVKNGIGYISDSGNVVAVLSSDGIYHYNKLTDENILISTNSVISSMGLSPSGRYLWCIVSDSKTLTRLDLSDMSQLTFGQADKVLYALDEVCVAASGKDSLIKAHFKIEGKDRFGATTVPLQAEIIWFDEATDTIFLGDYNMVVGQYPAKPLDVDGHIHGRQPALLAVRGKYALRQHPLSIVEWRQMFDDVFVAEGFNIGIGSFSASRDGSVAVMSLGVNLMQESYPTIILATDQGIRKVSLPFRDNDYHIVTSVAVSPDGHFIVACSNLGEIIIVRRSDMTLICSEQFKEGGCLGISFDANGHTFIAVDDHFIANPAPIIHIGDTLKGTIETPAGQPDWTLPENSPWKPWPQGNSRLFGNGRYALLGGYYVWDIERRREVVPKDFEIPYHQTELHRGDAGHVNQPPRCCIFEIPGSDIQLVSGAEGKVTILNLPSGKRSELKQELDLIGINCDGSILFMLDKQNNLTVFHNAGGVPIKLCVTAVYPSISDRSRFHAYTTDGYVVECDIYGREYGRAFVPDLWHAVPTTRGLACATQRGPVMLCAAK